MGAWAEGSFDNDDAGDWVWELKEAEDTAILEEVFSVITDTDDYLEAPDCSIAIAAAEVVAAMRKRPAAKLPPEVQAYVARIGNEPSPDLVAAALAALKRLRIKSELQELWDEGDKGDKWHKTVEELESRLR